MFPFFSKINNKKKFEKTFCEKRNVSTPLGIEPRTIWAFDFLKKCDILKIKRKNTITSRSNFWPYLSDLFKKYIIPENTTYSVLNLNKLMSRLYTTYIRSKNLIFIHPRNPFYIARSICAVKNKCARANSTVLAPRATIFSTELDRSKMRAIFFLDGIWKIIEWSTCGFFFPVEIRWRRHLFINLL